MNSRLFGLAFMVLGVVSVSRLPAPPIPAPGAETTVLERHLLDDTDAVLYLNVKQAMASPMFTKHFKKDLEKLLAVEEVAGIVRGTGIDLFKDVHQIAVLLGNSCHAQRLKQDVDDGPVLVFFGTFDKAKIDKHLASEATEGKLLQAVQHDGATYYRIKVAGSGPYVACLDKSTLVVAGQKTQIKEQTERVQGKSKAKLKYPVIGRFVKSIKPGSTFEAFAMESMILGSSHSSIEDGKGVREEKTTHHKLGDNGIESFTIRAVVKDEAEASVKFTAKKGQEAALKKFEDQFENAKKEVGQIAEKLPQFRPVVELMAGIKVANGKDGLTFEGRATAEQLRAAVEGLIFGVQVK